MRLFKNKVLAHDTKLSNQFNYDGDEIPKGGWRTGGEEIPAGGWRMPGEEIPKGGWRTGGEEIPKGGWRTGGGEIPAGGWRMMANEFKGGWKTPSTHSDCINACAVVQSNINHDEIPNGSWYSNIDVYRTRYGNGYFKFRFNNIGSHYEIDILAMPSYNQRPVDLHLTHRLPSTRGGYKICFGDPTILTSLSTAKKWAAMWSELTMKYIKYGIPFPNN